MTQALQDIEVKGQSSKASQEILTPEALKFLAALHQEFNNRRELLLKQRSDRQKQFNLGNFPDFLPETEAIRKDCWQVAPAPSDLLDRRVEITGPCERKMMINALNSGANTFMADLEDSLSPTWQNIIDGQINLKQAVRKTLTFTSPEGKAYELNQKTSTLIVRPRGWHLLEKNLRVANQAISASLCDFGLYFFHNTKALLERGSGPYFYLPKLESHLEARLWNDVFNYAQDKLQIPRGSIRATVLIETIPAAFEMDEILYELKDHASGLNAGRWDYIFSIIKKFQNHEQFVLPDRQQVTMTVPFMNAYCQLIVQTCHERGAHAMGGMAAFIPSRKEPAVNEIALAKVKEDKQREVKMGFDGTWVAHPDLVPIAKSEFDTILGERPHQKDHLQKVAIVAQNLLDTTIQSATVTESGVRNNINVALQYLESWLRGQGAAAIHNLMEDAATAEIARSQLWQWLNHQTKITSGQIVDKKLCEGLIQEEMKDLTRGGLGRYPEAESILSTLIFSSPFPDFLTLLAYEYLV